MSDLQALHGRASRNFVKVVGNVSPDQASLPTPCTEWNVHQLLNHVVSENLWVAPMLAGKSIGEVGTIYDGDVLGTNPMSALEESAAAAESAVDAPGALEATCKLSYGEVPGTIYIGHRLIDLVIHGWDLATATGQDTTIDPELVEALEKIVAPELEGLQGSGVFGTPQMPADSANKQTVLLASLGRKG